MPVLEIYTNKTISNKKEIAVKASKLMADLLGKPESVIPPSPTAVTRLTCSS
jgi:phenylpyruvate tautomerase PptA (4-oxalocrotonate tautomerase family)